MYSITLVQQGLFLRLRPYFQKAVRCHCQAYSFLLCSLRRLRSLFQVFTQHLRGLHEQVQRSPVPLRASLRLLGTTCPLNYFE